MNKSTVAIAAISLFTIFAASTFANDKPWLPEIQYRPGCVSESWVSRASKTTIIYPRKRTCLNESRAPGGFWRTE